MENGYEIGCGRLLRPIKKRILRVSNDCSVVGSTNKYV